MKRLPTMLVRHLPVAALCALLSACNGYVGFGSPIGSAFSVGGTLSGLPGGQSIVLLNNGRDSLTLAANGAFVFGGLVPFNGSYLVTISAQPASANCTVANGSGTVDGDVNNVQVTCVPR
jgi:predicted small secreted protein